MCESSSKIFPEKRMSKLPGGYMGKILRVNLTDGTTKDENLPENNVLRRWLGGQGLAQYILANELKEYGSQIGPTSPENILCLMTGPLTGNGITPGGVTYQTTAVSNVTAFGSHKGTVASGSGQGDWAVYLKFAGYDGIIVTGKSEKPVFLWINDGQAEIRDAGHIWGRDSHETVNLVQYDVKQPNAKVAAIGPAGENLVPAAMITNDYNHSASHGGGVVMGSKNLKAIAVYGTKQVPVANREALVESARRWSEKVTPYKYPKVGASVEGTYHQTRHGVGYGSRLGPLIVKNWQTAELSEANKDFDKQQYTARPCYKCHRACPYDVIITNGKHAGHVATLNAGSEHHEGTAYTFGIGGPDVRYLVDLADRLGLEATHFGAAAGALVEAYQKGLITSEDTEGLELEWGNVDLVEKMMKMMAFREGRLGNLMAEGPVEVAEFIGEKGHDITCYIKKGAPAAHNWKPYVGMMLGQVISSGGVKPQFAGFEVPQINLKGGAPDLGYHEPTPYAGGEEKAREVFLCGANRFFMGAAGICWFAVPIDKSPMQDVINALSAITGWEDFNLEEGLKIGDRIWQSEHLFHIHNGWTPEEDLEKVGARFLEPIPDGKYKGLGIKDFLPGLIYDFYRVCGWDEKTGKPTAAKLKELGLEQDIP